MSSPRSKATGRVDEGPSENSVGPDGLHGGEVCGEASRVVPHQAVACHRGVRADEEVEQHARLLATDSVQHLAGTVGRADARRTAIEGDLERVSPAPVY